MLEPFGRGPRHRPGDGVAVFVRQVGEQPRDVALQALPAGRAAEERCEGLQVGGQLRQRGRAGFGDHGRFHKEKYSLTVHHGKYGFRFYDASIRRKIYHKTHEVGLVQHRLAYSERETRASRPARLCTNGCLPSVAKACPWSWRILSSDTPNCSPSCSSVHGASVSKPKRPRTMARCRSGKLCSTASTSAVISACRHTASGPGASEASPGPSAAPWSASTTVSRD